MVDLLRQLSISLGFMLSAQVKIAVTSDPTYLQFSGLYP